MRAQRTFCGAEQSEISPESDDKTASDARERLLVERHGRFSGAAPGPVVLPVPIRIKQGIANFGEARELQIIRGDLLFAFRIIDWGGRPPSTTPAPEVIEPEEEEREDQGPAPDQPQEFPVRLLHRAGHSRGDGVGINETEEPNAQERNHDDQAACAPASDREQEQ